MGDIDIYSGDILLEETYKTQNILIDDISNKTFMGSMPLRIRFNKIDSFIEINNEIKYLMVDHSWVDKIFDSIKYLISEKSGTTDSIDHNFARIRIDSYNSLPIEKILTFHNVMILIKSVIDKNKSNYYYNIFLEKGLYKDKCNTYFLMNLFIL